MVYFVCHAPLWVSIQSYRFLFKDKADLSSSRMVTWCWESLSLNVACSGFPQNIWWKVCFTSEAAAIWLTTEPYIEQMLNSCLSNKMKSLDNQRVLISTWARHVRYIKTLCPNLHRVAWPPGLDVWVCEAEFSSPLFGHCPAKIEWGSSIFILVYEFSTIVKWHFSPSSILSPEWPSWESRR